MFRKKLYEKLFISDRWGGGGGGESERTKKRGGGGGERELSTQKGFMENSATKLCSFLSV